MKNQIEPSFLQIVEENKENIYRICNVYSVSPIEPQDLFQEVIYQVWRSLPSFKGNSGINTWVYKIAINVCYTSKIRLEKKNLNFVRLDSIKFIAAETSPDKDQQEKYDVLKSCISSLSESDKTIVVLSLEELPYKEIAEITGLTENHVAVKMKRIKKILLKCITRKLK